jgi:hypothetical protein
MKVQFYIFEREWVIIPTVTLQFYRYLSMHFQWLCFYFKIEFINFDKD